MTSGLSPDQLRQRLAGITATDISAICGVNPWKRPIDVFMDKTGRAQPFEGNIKTKWGNLLEPVLRDDYEEIFGVRVEVPGTLTHPEHEWWMATPDGIVYPIGGSEPERGLEIKVHGPEALRMLSYGDPGTDEVPMHELFQCEWGMGATGLPRWDLRAFLGGAPSDFIIQRDDELLGILAERAERFMTDYVRRDEPPPADGSDAWDAYLEQRFAKHNDQIVLVDDDYTLRLIAELREARAVFDRSEVSVEELSQKIKAIIGDRAGLTWKDPDKPKPKRGKGEPMSTISWKSTKPSIRTDWEKVSADLRTRAQLVLSQWQSTLERCAVHECQEIAEAVQAASAALADIASTAAIDSATTEVPGNRPFNVPRYWKKEDQAA